VCTPRRHKNLNEVSLNEVLTSAEKEYSENIAKRSLALGKAYPRTRGRLEATMLVPVYPCAQELRLGQWGEGGSGCVKGIGG